MTNKRPLMSRRAEQFFLYSALLLVVVIGVLSYRAWMAYHQQRDQVATTRQIVQGAEDLLGALRDAETGQRGFLLTGDEVYLDPYRSALAEIPVGLDKLATAVGTRADQVQRLERLRPLLNNKLDELAETIRLKRGRGIDAALAVVLTNRGNSAMVQARQVCSEIQSAAYARLLTQTEETRASVNQMGLFSTLGSLTLFIWLVISWSVIQRGARQREALILGLEKSDAEVREGRDWLQTTISSIGDAVIATDASGKINVHERGRLRPDWMDTGTGARPPA